jgi:hypothetical protein
MDSTTHRERGGSLALEEDWSKKKRWEIAFLPRS